MFGSLNRCFAYRETMHGFSQKSQVKLPIERPGPHRPPLHLMENALAFGWMHILSKRRPVPGENCALGLVLAVASAVGTIGAALLTGCASPGPPLPPSLKLPQPVTDLTAARVGGQVVLHWTTPAHTTDRVLVTGPVTAEICRDTVKAAAPPPAPSRGRRAPAAPCNVVQRAQVSPGASEVADTLPAALTSGAAGVLGYRVQLLNAAGRTAGPSAAVYAASGAAPEAVTGLRGTSTKPGVVLEWTHATQPSDSVELDRVLQVSNAPAKPVAAKSSKDLLAGSSDPQTESRFSARDTGGAIDRTAQPGQTYHYTVQRVHEVPFGGKMLEIRSEASAPVEVAVQTTFPPDMPTGLVAAPGYSQTGGPAIDLSWEPNVELHVSGYKVYRRRGNAQWEPLTSEPVRVAAYTDTAVTAGQRYTYRVTAVNDAGMESSASAEAAQAAPSR
jgi:hypothetical protein